VLFAQFDRTEQGQAGPSGYFCVAQNGAGAPRIRREVPGRQKQTSRLLVEPLQPIRNSNQKKTADRTYCRPENAHTILDRDVQHDESEISPL
jgi:hypothetical protein